MMRILRALLALSALVVLIACGSDYRPRHGAGQPAAQPAEVKCASKQDRKQPNTVCLSENEVKQVFPKYSVLFAQTALDGRHPENGTKIVYQQTDDIKAPNLEVEVRADPAADKAWVAFQSGPAIGGSALSGDYDGFLGKEKRQAMIHKGGKAVTLKMVAAKTGTEPTGDYSAQLKKLADLAASHM